MNRDKIPPTTNWKENKKLKYLLSIVLSPIKLIFLVFMFLWWLVALFFWFLKKIIIFILSLLGLLLLIMLVVPIAGFWSIRVALSLPTTLIKLWKHISKDNDNAQHLREQIISILPTILISIAVLSTGISLAINLGSDNPSFLGWLEGWIQNISTDMLGAVITFVLLDRVLRRVEEFESEEQKHLQAQMQAISRLWEAQTIGGKQAILNEMVKFKLLEKSDLSGINLQRMNFHKNDIHYIKFHGADLTGANFQKAIFYETQLNDTYLSGADFTQAHIHFDDLIRANTLRNAIMMDGKLYDGRLHLSGDLSHARSLGINLRDPNAMCNFYNVPLNDYQAGLKWAIENLNKLRSGGD